MNRLRASSSLRAKRLVRRSFSEGGSNPSRWEAIWIAWSLHSRAQTLAFVAGNDGGDSE
jgi:hypothetical protein